MKRSILNIGVDLETASKLPTAAILSIAAQPFSLGHYLEVEEVEPFYECINATSCVLCGMHFEDDTVKFWSEQSDEAKAELLKCDAKSIRMALEGFVKYVEYYKGVYNANEVHIWAHGIDFDIATLKMACATVLGTQSMPWIHYNVRDARTYVLEFLSNKFPDVDNVYDLLPPFEGYIPHYASSDVKRMIHNLQNTYKLITE